MDTIGFDNPLKKADLYQYVQLLRERGILKSKQTSYLDSLCLYTNNGEVYKIMMTLDPKLLKKARKAGIHQPLTLIKNNLPKNKLISPPKINIDNGLFIIQYIFKNQTFNCLPGESKMFL